MNKPVFLNIILDGINAKKKDNRKASKLSHLGTFELKKVIIENQKIIATANATYALLKTDLDTINGSAVTKIEVAVFKAMEYPFPLYINNLIT